MTSIPILHFNDVYRVQPFKFTPTSKETIDVTQWLAMLDDVRESWPSRDDGKRDGLVLFSGDIFAPSTESSVTRGSHMVPVVNEIAPDVSLTGNHDFDFGFLHLSKLIQDTKFPWLLSNIIDERTSKIPEPLLESVVLERAGVRIGVIGLVEKEWIATVSSWPSEFKYQDVAEIGLQLSKKLRDPDGEYKCDIIIALTHARIPNDITFAKALSAHSPAVQKEKQTASTHGVDIILGGHDHLYYISKGVTSWRGYDIHEEVLGAEKDEGDILIVKSGTDFRDLSEFTLELEDTSEGSVRKKLIKAINGIRHCTQPNSKSNERLGKILEKLLSSVSTALKAPVCKADIEIDCRSSVVRVAESASGNWFADVLRHAYDEALCLEGGGGSDGVFICGGTIRGDSTYGPGAISLGDIMEILPFEDPIVVLEVDGETLWAAMESSLSTWPAQEGRFPVVSGFRVSWDSRRPAGHRVLGIWLVEEPSASRAATPYHSGTSSPAALSQISLTAQTPGQATPELHDIEEVKRVKGGRKYKLITREYMAEGHDGFEAFKGCKYLVDDESGELMSTIVRKYLLGCRFVYHMSHLRPQERIEILINSATKGIIERERARLDRFNKSKAEIVTKWRRAMRLAVRYSRAHYKELIHITSKEHMSDVDCFDGSRARAGSRAEVGRLEEDDSDDCDRDRDDDDLVLIHPVVDGRLKDQGRS
ncbi:Metallo-dependent phosphatase [Irpex rosettiformis]|uniref:Metallo-dependent phosphatase n=1 Tax=Irpex rosettiformis TaxID=378272 RepID=A0ACB8TU35_9APHY|nr:Metallo-dependent phosphatase [Irpex rosettiformis]